MELVWNVQWRVPTDRVTTTKECGGGDTHPRDEEYFETGWRSPKSRRHMFGIVREKETIDFEEKSQLGQQFEVSVSYTQYESSTSCTSVRHVHKHFVPHVFSLVTTV